MKHKLDNEKKKKKKNTKKKKKKKKKTLAKMLITSGSLVAMSTSACKLQVASGRARMI